MCSVWPTWKTGGISGFRLHCLYAVFYSIYSVDQISFCHRIRQTCRLDLRGEPCCTHSSAISALESSYKKHLLHFVLSMMLWKINTAMVCLLLRISVRDSVSIHVYLTVCALSHSLYSCLPKCWGLKHVVACRCNSGRVVGGNGFQLYADIQGLHHQWTQSWFPAAFHLLHLVTLFPMVSTYIDSTIDETIGQNTLLR